MQARKPLILIVDDNTKNLQVLANILKNAQYQVAVALNGIEALTFIKKLLPDLILLDVAMPEMNGFDFCKQLKQGEQNSKIPVIFLTAKTDAESISTGFELGGVDYITKPFNAKELIARVNTHLELKEIRETLEEKVRQRTEQLEEANKKLTKLNKSKNDFLLLVNNQLNTPLSRIAKMTQVLKERPSSANHNDILESISLYGERLNRLSKLTQMIATIKSENFETRSEPVLLNEFFVQLIQSISEELKTKNLSVTTEIIPQDSMFVIDKTLLNILLVIIFDNAIKHSPANQTISLTAQCQQQNLLIEIKDHGKGFDEHNLVQINHILKLDSDEYHQRGDHLGLATAKLISNLLSGSIEIESNKEEGVTVRLSFTN